VEFEDLKFCKPSYESMAELGLDVDKFHEGGHWPGISGMGQRRRVNETRDPLAQLGSDPIWK
jgi:hypothetical protein